MARHFVNWDSILYSPRMAKSATSPIDSVPPQSAEQMERLIAAAEDAAANLRIMWEVLEEIRIAIDWAVKNRRDCTHSTAGTVTPTPTDLPENTLVPERNSNDRNVIPPPVRPTSGSNGLASQGELWNDD